MPEIFLKPFGGNGVFDIEPGANAGNTNLNPLYEL
jgi:hypothetical protein